MSERELLVLDASVGVKWVKPETGSADALALLRAHGDGDVRLVVATHFLHEVVGVAARHGGASLGRATWQALRQARLTAIGLDDRLAEAAFRQVERLGCSFYDALAPALAFELGARLVSADARAHRGVTGVRLL